MTELVSNGPESAVVAREATISDVREGMEQLSAAVHDFSASDESVGDVADKAQRQQIIEAAQKVLNAVKKPDDVWVDSRLPQNPISAPPRTLAHSQGVFGRIDQND